MTGNCIGPLHKFFPFFLLQIVVRKVMRVIGFSFWTDFIFHFDIEICMNYLTTKSYIHDIWTRLYVEYMCLRQACVWRRTIYRIQPLKNICPNEICIKCFSGGNCGKESWYKHDAVWSENGRGNENEEKRIFHWNL